MSYCFVIGTQNHHARGLMLDGEVTVTMSDGQVAMALVDCYFLRFVR